MSDTHQEERVQVRVEDAVAFVTLNRPEKRNGLDVAMFDALIDAGRTLAARNDVRAVVLAGHGPAFCAGLDFKSFMMTPNAAPYLLSRTEESPANIAQRVAWIWQEVPVPVIAALHGPCFGGGLQIALGADVRLAAPDTRLSVMEIEWGLIPDMAITCTLLPNVRMDIAKELTFTGRIVNADEAASLGLVTRVCDDPHQEAKALATAIAGRSPHAIRAAKALFNGSGDQDTAGSLQLESELQTPLLGSPNQMAAVQARMMKRTPSFRDPE